MEKKYLNHKLANGLNLVSRLRSSKDPVRCGSSWSAPTPSLAVRGSVWCPKGSPFNALDAWVGLATSGFGVKPRNRRPDYTHEQPISKTLVPFNRGEGFSISGVVVVRRRLRLCNAPPVTNSKPDVAEYRRGALLERGSLNAGCGFKPRVWATLQSLLSLGGV